MAKAIETRLEKLETANRTRLVKTVTVGTAQEAESIKAGTTIIVTGVSRSAGWNATSNPN